MTMCLIVRNSYIGFNGVFFLFNKVYVDGIGVPDSRFDDGDVRRN